RADVGALAVAGGRVVDGEEHSQEVRVGELGWVEVDLDHFGVAGPARADILIGGVRSTPSSVAGEHGADAAQLGQDGLGAPEAPSPKGRGLGRRRAVGYR